MTATDPFAALHAEIAPQTPLRAAITAATRVPEAEALAPLLGAASLPPEHARAAPAQAHHLLRT